MKEIADTVKLVCNESNSLIFSAFPTSERKHSKGKEDEIKLLSLNGLLQSSRIEEDCPEYMMAVM